MIGELGWRPVAVDAPTAARSVKPRFKAITNAVVAGTECIIGVDNTKFVIHCSDWMNRCHS